MLAFQVGDIVQYAGNGPEGDHYGLQGEVTKIEKVAGYQGVTAYHRVYVRFEPGTRTRGGEPTVSIDAHERFFRLVDVASK